MYACIYSIESLFTAQTAPDRFNSGFLGALRITIIGDLCACVYTCACRCFHKTRPEPHRTTLKYTIIRSVIRKSNKIDSGKWVFKWAKMFMDINAWQ